jgi:DNA polymerase-3 subunit alpha
VLCWASRPGQGNRPAQKGWVDWEGIVKSGEPVVVHGQVKIDQRDDENPRAEIVATDVELLAAVRSQKTRALSLRIDVDGLTPDRATSLKGLLGRHPGPCTVTVRAVIPRRSETTVRVPHKVAATDELIESARRLGFEVELH